MALRGRFWTVTAGRLLRLCCIQARRCIEQQGDQTEERRESVQRFLHLFRHHQGWTFHSAKLMQRLRNFSFFVEQWHVIHSCIR